MSIQEKIDSAQPSSWLTEGLPKWRVKLIVWWAKFKARILVRYYEQKDKKFRER